MIGFHEIPQYSRYLISPSGVVVLRESGKAIRGSINPAGYCNFRLMHDSGIIKTWGRHRILMYVFRYPGPHFETLYVNHINGVKGDDYLDNLEWCTPRENVEHAGRMGLTEKCTPVSVRDILTGEITEYPSMTDCAKKLGITKDAVSWRCKYGESKVFQGSLQFRYGGGKTAWYNFEDPQLAVALAVPTKPILVKDHVTGKVLRYNSLRALAKFIGLSDAAVSVRLNKSVHPVVSGRYQLKWLGDDRDWRSPTATDFTSYKGSRQVSVKDHSTGETTVYASCKQCAEALGLKPTTLAERLKNADKIFKDGKSFSYV